MGAGRRFTAGLRVFILWLAALACCAGAFAADEPFDWRQCAGQTLRLMLNNHPYAGWIKRGLRDFEKSTGIRTVFAMYPDDRYFARLDAAFADPFGRPDVYLIGVYQSWDYAARGRMLPLDGFIADTALTARSYNAGDFYPPIIAAFRGSNAPDAAAGGDSLRAVPVGFVGDDPESARSNLLVQGLAVNPKSANREAAWLFVQYFTSQSFQTSLISEWKTISPPRRSVFENPVFQRSLAAKEKQP